MQIGKERMPTESRRDHTECHGVFLYLLQFISARFCKKPVGRRKSRCAYGIEKSNRSTNPVNMQIGTERMPTEGHGVFYVSYNSSLRSSVYPQWFSVAF